jgi:glycerate kinase
MKIVIAPDSFKESLAAPEVADQIEAGFRDVFPDADCLKFPMADGGEGTVEALVAATHGRIVTAQVTSPLGEKVEAFYGVTGDGEIAVIEMAAASGLALVPPKLRNPLKTTSYGTGELIQLALDAGLRHFIIGIGGSATNDGGAGMLQALGVKLLDRNGEEIGFGGEALGQLERIDISGVNPRLRQCRIEVACDVDNPLTGPNGASVIFGPQKGASPAMVAELDENLTLFAGMIKQDLHRDVADVPGAGAAGGMGAALLAFLDADLRPGIEIIIEATGLKSALDGADLVITGEGCIDAQTRLGKAPVGVARIAKQQGIPVIAIAGSLGPDADIVHDFGIDAVFSVICRPCSLAEALAEAGSNVRSTARNVAAAVKIGKRF